MNSYQEIISNFIEMNYLENKNILGILFYGSVKYHTNNDNSDIDLLIVTDSSTNYKGVIYINGIKIEYFEKNIYYLLEQVDLLEQSQDCSLVSIFKNGEIIYSKNQTLEYLKEEILAKKYIINKQKKNRNLLLNEWYYYFNNLAVTENNSFFNYIFHNLLETIRKAYHKENGYAKIPTSKTYQLYTNKDYASKYYCVNLPDQTFIDLYLELMISGYNKELLDSLLKKVSYDNNYFKYGYKSYKKSELEYKSTIVENNVSRSINYLKTNHIAKIHYYYIALEKIRVLYCDINGIDDSISQFGNNYEEDFSSLFNECINGDNKEENLQNLFNFVTKTLNIDYKQYKVLELHK